MKKNIMLTIDKSVVEMAKKYAKEINDNEASD